MTVKQKIDKAIRELHAEGIYPSSGKINERLGRGKIYSLNGREIQFRNETFFNLGIEPKATSGSGYSSGGLTDHQLEIMTEPYGS